MTSVFREEERERERERGRGGGGGGQIHAFSYINVLKQVIHVDELLKSSFESSAHLYTRSEVIDAPLLTKV